MIMECRVSYTLICLGAIFASVLVIGLEITSAASKAWVYVKFDQMTFSFGLFTTEDSKGLVTVRAVKDASHILMQTLLLFSVALGIVGCVLTAISASQRTVCGRGYKFFVIFAQCMYALSGILFIVGLSVFTHGWLKKPKQFFSFTPKAEYYYGYAYWLAWLAVACQVLLTVFLVVCYSLTIPDNKPKNEKDLEKEKLLHSAATAVVEKAVVESTADPKPSSSST